MQTLRNIIQEIVRPLWRGEKKKDSSMFPKHRAHRPFLKRLSQLWGRHSAVSLFSQIVSMGKREQGDFCLSNLSEQDICLMFPYQLSHGDGWLMCFSGYSLPSPLAAPFHAVCWGLQQASRRAQLTSSPCGCRITSPAATSQTPQHLSWQSGG